MADPNELEKLPFRQSLMEKALMMGVSPDFLVLEGAIFCLFLIVFGTGLLGIGLSAAIVSGCHWWFRELSRQDPHLPRIILRHYLSQKRYEVGLHPREKQAKPPRSVPKDIRS